LESYKAEALELTCYEPIVSSVEQHGGYPPVSRCIVTACEDLQLKDVNASVDRSHYFFYQKNRFFILNKFFHLNHIV